MKRSEPRAEEYGRATSIGAIEPCVRETGGPGGLQHAGRAGEERFPELSSVSADPNPHGQDAYFRFPDSVLEFRCVLPILGC